MRVLGICCTKSELDVVLLAGTSRDDAKIEHQKKYKLPGMDRADDLVWARREVIEIVNQLSPDRAVVRVSEKSGQRLSPERGEVEGVVQEALAASRLAVKRHYSVTARAGLGCKTRAQLDAFVAATALLAGCPKTRIRPLLSAYVEIGAS